MTENNYDLIAERDKLQAEVARLRVERDTGVPANLLTPATTEDSARVLAESLLAWKGNTRAAAPPPIPAFPAYSVSQVSRQALRHLSPEQVTAVYHQGRLEGIGAPAPPPRRNGQRHAT
jgi:hypothetical protein